MRGLGDHLLAWKSKTWIPANDVMVLGRNLKDSVIEQRCRPRNAERAGLSEITFQSAADAQRWRNSSP